MAARIARTPLNQRQRELLWTKQMGLCGLCREKLDPRPEDDHIVPLHAGGTNELANRHLVHARCHRNKSNDESTARKKVRHLKFGKTRKSPPMPGSRASKWKHKMSGEWERR